MCDVTSAHVDAFGAKVPNMWSLTWGQFFAHGWTKRHKKLNPDDGSCVTEITMKDVYGPPERPEVVECAVSNAQINLNSAYLDQGQTYGDYKDIAVWMYSHIYKAAEQRDAGKAINMWPTTKRMGIRLHKTLDDVNFVIDTFFVTKIILGIMECRDRRVGRVGGRVATK